MSESRGTVIKAVLEVVLIGIGVFLGMAADQWRSDRQHRNQARDALQRFRVEIQTNPFTSRRLPRITHGFCR